MVNPSIAAHGWSAAPTDELLRLRPRLKLVVLALGIVVISELVAAYVSTALTDSLTAYLGLLLLRREVHDFVQGLPVFTMIAGLNFAFQAINLFQLLAGKPGAKYFFETECVVPVTVHRNGEVLHTDKNLCSWQTILGNVALSLGVILEFLCVRLSWKMYRSMLDAVSGMSSPMLSMMDLEASQGMPSLHPNGSRSANSPPGQEASAPINEQNITSVAPGLVPFSGPAHYLVD